MYLQSKKEFFKKIKGSVTIASMVLMISFMSFAMVITHFTRVRLAKAKIDQYSSSTLESIYMDYDKYLYNSYNIYALDKEKLSSNNFKIAFDRKKRVISKEDLFHPYRFSFKGVKIIENKTFEDIENLKYSILQAHYKDFVCNNMESMFKKLGAFNNFLQIKPVISLYQEAIMLQMELQKTFDEALDDFKNLENSIDNIDETGMSKCISNFNKYKSSVSSLEEKAKDTSKKISVIIKKIENTSIKGEVFSDKEKQEMVNNLKSYIGDLESGITEISTKLSSINSVVLDEEGFDIDIDAISIKEIKPFSIEENKADSGKFLSNLVSFMRKKFNFSKKREYGKLDGQAFSNLPSKRAKSSITSKLNSFETNEDLEDYFDKEQEKSKQEMNLSLGEDILNKFMIIDFVKSYFSCDSSSISKRKSHSLYPSEMEYILYGKQNELSNIEKAKRTVFLIRTISNTASLLLYKQKEINAIAGLFSFGVGYPVSYSITLSAWAFIESDSDMDILYGGGKVPIFKGPNDFNVDLNLKNIEKQIKEAVKNKIQKQNKKGQDKEDFTHFSYKDHLACLLFLRNEETLLRRIEDIMELKAKIVKPNFNIFNFSNFSTVETNVNIPYNKLKSVVSRGY